MTRLHTPLPIPPKPSSVALSELAIAAGVAGHGITLWYHDFPAPVLCQIWQYCTRYAGSREVRHIRTPADARKLADHVSDTRLALAYNARLCNPAAWAIQMAPGAEGQQSSRPALFCCGGCDTPENDPSASLLLRGDSREHVLVTQWLSTTAPDSPDWEIVPPAMTVQAVPALERLFSANRQNEVGLNCRRDQQVLQALLVGAALIRTLQQDGLVVAPLIVSMEDYELVRRLLQTPLVAAADDAYDPLAAAMVNRANLFLAVKNAPDLEGGNPFGGSDDSTNRGGRLGRELVTRRQLSDLGNVRSRLVRRLVAFLQRRPDGGQRFQRMGLVRRPPEGDAWRTARIDDLIGYLRPWTTKQVRVRFDQLRRAGMITAERPRDNGPWQYGLPEELTGRVSAFRSLPNVQDLLGRGPAP